MFFYIIINEAIIPPTITNNNIYVKILRVFSLIKLPPIQLYNIFKNKGIFLFLFNTFYRGVL